MAHLSRYKYTSDDTCVLLYSFTTGCLCLLVSTQVVMALSLVLGRISDRRADLRGRCRDPEPRPARHRPQAAAGEISVLRIGVISISVMWRPA